MAGAEIKVEKRREGPPTGPPVKIEINGEDIETLGALAEQSKNLIRDVPGLVNLKDDFAKAKPELRVLVDRSKATLLGLSTADISATVKTAISGSKVGRLPRGQGRVRHHRPPAPSRADRTWPTSTTCCIPTGSGGPGAAVHAWRGSSSAAASAPSATSTRSAW